MDNQSAPTNPQSYTVVARRYRPRSFGELIGQDHVAHALGTAIDSGRVGHAYLFTGARGVGKTSTARIFAKALNASAQVDAELATDIAQAIDSGDDMDVIEIDGASNRGIEEIRQLRANVNVRPSRAAYKIYIIDEVHMLTNQAFNALLKTLEEPPMHVKFIFCTTDPDKIPITVLSRCQRFDFVPVKLEAIQARLKEICSAEGFAAEDDALALLARRAAGSMRDSQSLLEQVISFSSDTITVEQVHQLLGIADEGHLLQLAEALTERQPLRAIELVEQTMCGGADAGQLAEQLLNYLRDLMTAAVGGGPELLKLANPAGHERLKQLAEQWGVSTILSAIQILDESLVRMRSSVSASALLEVALVQICQLSSLASIPALLDAIQSSAAGLPAARHAPPASEKKNTSATPAPSLAQPSRQSESAGHSPGPPRHASETSASRPSAAATAEQPVPPTAAGPDAPAPATQAPPPAVPPPPAAPPAPHRPQPIPASVATTNTAITNSPQTPAASTPANGPVTNGPVTNGPVAAGGGSSDALSQWKAAVSRIDGMLADFAGMAASVEPTGSDQWNVIFPPGTMRTRDYCEQAERKSELQAALQQTLGRSIRLSFSVLPGEAPRPVAATAPSTNRVQKMREASENPFVKKVCEVLDGEILRVDPAGQGFAPKGRPPTA